MTSRIMEEMMKEARKIGEEESQKEIAQRLLTSGKLTLEEIAECASLPLDEVRRLAEELPQ